MAWLTGLGSFKIALFWLCRYGGTLLSLSSAWLLKEVCFLDDAVGLGGFTTSIRLAFRNLNWLEFVALELLASLWSDHCSLFRQLLGGNLRQVL